MKIWVKKMLFIGILILLTTFLFVILIDRIVFIIGKKSIDAVDNVPSAQVAIILGAYVTPDGQLCDMLKDRVDTGVELYKSRKVKKLLLSGDHGKVRYDEVNNMRKYAESLGVPTEDIFMDHAGFSTYESIYRASEIFKVQSAIIVTQKFHLPRAMYIAKSLGLNATGVVSDRHIYYGAEVYEYREVPARLKAFVQVNTYAKPTFLGTEIPISGDGRATHDIK